jgi:hypothetical protein
LVAADREWAKGGGRVSKVAVGADVSGVAAKQIACEACISKV